MGFILIREATEELPVKIVTYSYNVPVSQFHNEAEILFCMYGECDILIGDKPYHMIPEDVCLINSNEVHYMNGIDSESLSICFSLKDILGVQADNTYFNLNSCGNTYSPQFDYIRYLIAQLVKINASGEDHFGTLSLMYALIGHLVERFQVSAPVSASNTKNNNILIPVAAYIEEHYAEKLTLSDLSEQFGITVPYLSSCFDKHMQTTFLKYYNKIRLSHAMHDMLTGNRSLEEIALRNGFNDIRSFTSAFKKKYNCVPSEYRRQHRIDHTNTAPKKNAVPLPEDEMKALVKYLNIYKDAENFMPANPDATVSIDAGAVNFQTNGVQLKHTFHKFCCVGSARQFLYADIQKMIRQTQEEIGFEYVKFHGILSDEMMVYYEDSKGSPVYSFTLIDKVLDFILSVNLKPLIQLSFMPRLLASDPNKLIDMWNYNTSPPKDINKWIDLVHAVTAHLITRYGQKQVESWLFCVWNEPDAAADSFGWEDAYEFFDFYRATYYAVKNMDPDIPFGTPSLLLLPQEEKSWSERFLEYCSANGCEPDFLNIHYYDNNFQNSHELYSERFSMANLGRFSPLSEDPFTFTKFINSIKSRVKKLPIYLTEWNLTISQRDLINDTCFKACYLTKNILQNYDRLDSYGYWNLTDFHEELPLPNELYHGGLGMFTYNGIPKAHYYAFRFLNHLGDELIGIGNGYFITKKRDDIFLIVYNYEHYSKLFANGILFDMDSENRYAPFLEMKKAHFKMELDNFPTSFCLIKELFINQNSGSSYDTWIKMGGPLLDETQELSLLNEQALPGQVFHRQQVSDGKLLFETDLAPLEVRLIHIRPVQQQNNS